MSYQPKNPNGQALMVNSEPVVIASDQTAVPVSFTGSGDVATQTTLAALNTKVTAVDTGAVTISTALPVGTNNIGDVDVLTVPAPLNVIGTGAAATALRVHLSDESLTALENISVTVPGTVDLGTVSLTALETVTVENSTLSVVGSGLGTDALRVIIATDNDVATQTTLAAINNKLVSGTDIGDVTVNNLVSAPVHVRLSDGTSSLPTSNGVNTGALRVTLANDSTGKIATLTNQEQMNGQAISMGTGVRDAGTQRVTIATNDSVLVTGAAGVSLALDSTATSIKTAVELLDNVVVVHDAAAVTSMNMVGGYASSTAPTAVVNGDAARIWTTLNGAVNIADGGNIITVDGSGSAGTPATGVVTIQGITSGTPVTVGQSTATNLKTQAEMYQGGAAVAIGNALYSRITDGTNTMPTADTVGRSSYHRITDGTNTAAIIPTINSLKADLSSVGGNAVVTGGTNGTQGVAGIQAHDAAIAGNNPLLNGGYAKAAAPVDVSADGDLVNAWFLRNGAQVVNIAAGGALISGDATNGLEIQGAGVAGTPAGGVVSIQGVSSGTAIPISGSVTATVSSTTITGGPAIGAGLYTRITNGTTMAAVKAASTAAVATDPALVVALSPNGTAFGSGTNGTTVQRVTIATDDTNIAAIKTAVELLDDTVATLGTTTYTEATSKGLVIGAVRRDADTTLVSATNEVGPLQMDANGRLKVAATQALGTAGTRWFTQISDGTTSPAIKAASTAALATDPALVVAISPNNTVPVSLANTQASGTLAGVAITGTGGQFSCTANRLHVGMLITLSGTYGGTGSITGYANPTTYKVSVTNGSTTFTLVTLVDGALTTTAGTPTGITYTIINPTVTISGAATGTQSNPSLSTTSATLLAANTARRGATVYNGHTAVCYVRLSATAASSTTFTVKLNPEDYYEVPAGYNGAITAILASGTAITTVQVTEIS